MMTTKTITITFATAVGCRAAQEDRYLGFPITGRGYRAWMLGVFDGHLGFAASDRCEKALYRMSVPAELSDPQGFLREVVAYLDGETRGLYEGTTVSLALIVRQSDGKETAWVAVLGDSPVIVLDRSGVLHVGPDHNIRSNPWERDAAIVRGGVVSGGYLCPPRSDFGLQMGRALGDSWMGDILSREPEILAIPDPVWVLVASDGVLDPTHQESFSREDVRELAERNASADDVLAWVKSVRYVPKDNATAVVWSTGRRRPVR